MKKIIFLLSLFFTSFCFSQNSDKLTLHNKIKSEGYLCENDSLSKQAMLEVWYENTWRVLLKGELKNCENTFNLPVPKKDRTFRLSVSAEGYEPVVIKFDVKAQTSGIYNVEDIVLKKKKDKVKEISEVTITGVKKEFFKVEADKTIFQVKNNDLLSNGSAHDAILRIPGILMSPSGDISMNGKISAIYIDGIPSNLSGNDLSAFIQSLPANTIEKIEVVSNPGTSYDANTSGGVINIVTQGRGLKGVNGTINLNYGVNNNQKFQSSLLLNVNKKFTTWQTNIGYNYIERDLINNTKQDFLSVNPFQIFERISNTNFSDKQFFVKPSLNIKITDKSNLFLKYSLSFFNTKDFGVSSFNDISNKLPINFLLNDSKGLTKKSNNEFISKYKVKLDDLDRTIEVTSYYSFFNKASKNNSLQDIGGIYNYSINDIRLNLSNFYSRADVSYPFKNIDLMLNAGVKYSYINALTEGKYNLNNLTNLFESPFYSNFIDFDYLESNLAIYSEFKKKLGKFQIGGGLRWENLKYNSKVEQYNKEIKYASGNIFPSLNFLYNITSNISFVSSYSKKISSPSYSDLDPNNSGYFDKYNSSTGNPLLKPSFSNNYEAKITAFNYVFIGANYSKIKDANMVVFEVQDNSILTNKTIKTFSEVNNFSLNFGIPLPFAMFSQGLSFFKSKNINIDKLNYMYINGSYNSYNVKDINNSTEKRAIYSLGCISQIILPGGIKTTAQYNFFSKGTYQIYQITKPIQSFDISISKSFYKKDLRATISVVDVFNTNEINALGKFTNTNINYHQKNDTRVFWFKLSYKFGKLKSQSKENREVEVENKKVENNKDLFPGL